MALLPTYRSAFQTARQTTGFPSYNVPQVAAPPAWSPIPGLANAPADTSPFAAPTIPSTVSGSGPMTVQPRAGRPSLTVNQAANRQVNQVLAPQLAAARVSANQQNNAIKGFAAALMGKLQPIAGQVAADWNQAIGQTGALANNAATFLQQANPTPQVQALLQSVNAPAAQQAQLAGNLGQTFGGGAAVLNFLGGAVPGTEMANQKAAAVTQAAGYPTLAYLRGAQDTAAAAAQQAKDRATIEATRGQLYVNARQNILQNVAARQTAAATARYHAAELGLSAAKIKQAGQIAAARTTQAQQAAGEKRREFDVSTAQKQYEFGVTAKAKQAAADFLQWYRTQGINQSQSKIDEKAKEFGVTSQQAGQRIAISAQNAQTSARRAQTAASQGAQRIAQEQQRLAIEQRRERAYERSQAFKQQAKQKGISATSYANLRKQALAKADLFYYGKAPTNMAGTNGIAGIDYGPALQQLINGYSLSRADAQAILNDFYAPGERGRPAAPPVTVRSKGPLGVSATASP